MNNTKKYFHDDIDDIASEVCDLVAKTVIKDYKDCIIESVMEHFDDSFYAHTKDAFYRVKDSIGGERLSNMVLSLLKEAVNDGIIKIIDETTDNHKLFTKIDYFDNGKTNGVFMTTNEPKRLLISFEVREPTTSPDKPE